MFGPPQKKRLTRGMKLLFALTLGVLMLEFLLKPSEQVIAWTGLMALVILGGVFFVMPLELTEQDLVNRWYHVASWAAWILCSLLGLLFISAAVAWGITGPTLEQLPAVTRVVLTTVLVVGLVGVLLVGGLAVAGWIAQGSEATRQWSRSQSRNNSEAGAGSAREETPPA